MDRSGLSSRGTVSTGQRSKYMNIHFSPLPNPHGSGTSFSTQQIIIQQFPRVSAIFLVQGFFGVFSVYPTDKCSYFAFSQDYRRPPPPPHSKSYRAHPPCLGTPPYVLHENLALTHFYDYLDRHVGGVQRSQSYCTIYLNFI